MMFHDLDSQSEYLVLVIPIVSSFGVGIVLVEGLCFCIFLAYVQKSSYVSSIFKRFAEYLLHVTFLV